MSKQQYKTFGSRLLLSVVLTAAPALMLRLWVL
jgi:hypothetical protein